MVISRWLAPRKVIRNALALNSGSVPPVTVLINQIVFRVRHASQRASSEKQMSWGGLDNSTGGNEGSSLPALYSLTWEAVASANSKLSADITERKISMGTAIGGCIQAPES